MAGAGEEYEDYQYPDWGVDRVDLDFKSGWGCVELSRECYNDIQFFGLKDKIQT